MRGVPAWRSVQHPSSVSALRADPPSPTRGEGVAPNRSMNERASAVSVKLSSNTLGELPSTVAAPTYRRSDLRAGIVHFGVGNFHRAHQAVYLDDLFNAGSDHDWALIGAGVFEAEKVGRQKLEEQDWLTTIVEQDSGHMEARVTGVMVDFLMPGDAGAII